MDRGELVFFWVVRRVVVMFDLEPKYIWWWHNVYMEIV